MADLYRGTVRAASTGRAVALPWETRPRLGGPAFRGLQIPGWIFRRVLGPLAMFVPTPTGSQGTLYPDEYIWSHPGYDWKPVQLGRHTVVVPARNAPDLARARDAGTLAPASALPVLPVPKVLDPGGHGVPTRSPTRGSTTGELRELALPKYLAAQAAERARAAARYQRVVDSTAQAVANLADRLDATLDQGHFGSSVSRADFIYETWQTVWRDGAWQQVRVNKFNEAAYRSALAQERARQQAAAAADAATLRAMMEDAQERHRDAVERAAAARDAISSIAQDAALEGMANVDLPALEAELEDLAREEARRRGVTAWQVMSLAPGRQGVAITTQRFGDRANRDKRRQRDKKSGEASRYRRALQIINRTYGRFDEGVDLLNAAYYATEFSGSDKPIAGMSYRQWWQGLEAGTLKIDPEKFVANVIQNEAQDIAIGKLSRGARNLSVLTGRPVGVSAGPAL